MATEKGRVTGGVRTGKRVGPNYDESYYRNPVNADIEHEYHMGKDDRTLESPNEETLTLAGQKLSKDGKYDSYWGSGREPLGKGGK